MNKFIYGEGDEEQADAGAIGEGYLAVLGEQALEVVIVIAGGSENRAAQAG